MTDLPQRKGLRLRNYDYAQAGYYFITICSKDRLNIFGKVVVGADDPVRPQDLQTRYDLEKSRIGEVVCECWNKINELYKHVETDAFCLMPNHIHGIIIISNENVSAQASGGQGRPPLQKIIQGFKSVTTRMCFRQNHPVIWQRGYYDHVIRNEDELNQIREYIIYNPDRWHDDDYYTQ